ncbi:DUF6343 family protein [Streptomyces sp. NPDC127038]|uniref:DUF6343 family protein n=1 Tax=Streptomyces sp. NPDC127038 TaxID=3347114 RepID=UPI003663C24A
MRTGSEPVTARSALRMRLWLSVWGLIWAIFGTVVFILVGQPGWAAACAALWVIVTVDMTMILRHIREGPHYQPGRDVPPYEPVDERRRYRPPERRRPSRPSHP